ncbi:hypothetical protein PRK78_004639 [Emydomyces testavorans]|uniref:NmrA-like domain-containing protein n=1 Tax=Emydomyces testavorans TaxID=2070801 RepID=A0AAF0IIS8_9EURO|nr:hypothetical protein PRK78_004639 [Emydomyces testavorans]
MVHIVIAGGAGNVGREVVEELASQGKHEVTVFALPGESPQFTNPKIAVRNVDYQDQEGLIDALKGVDTVLSFVSSDPDNQTQKALVDACVAAGVKRFAPSEWALRSDSSLPDQQFKRDMHKYLQEINAERPVLEYTLFEPGLFMNYLAYPYKTTKYLHNSPLFMSLEEKQAIKVDDGEDWHVYTDIQDVAKVVARAIDYPGKWPEIGGMVGERIQMKSLIKLVESVLGEPLTVHTVKRADLEKGEAQLPWLPPFSHPKVPAELREALAQRMYPQFLLAGVHGDLDVDATWNTLLPDYKFTSIEALLRKGLSQRD